MNFQNRYAQGVVPTVAKYSTSPIGLVKPIPGAAVKSIYSQHDEYYVCWWTIQRKSKNL